MSGLPGRPPSPAKALATRASATPAAAGDGSAPEPPEELTGRALHYWTTYVPDLAATGVLVASDGILLARFCRYLSLADKAAEALASEDPGSLEEKRLRVALKDYEKLAMDIAASFGLTPVARTRLGLMRLQGASFLEAWQSARAE